MKDMKELFNSNPQVLTLMSYHFDKNNLLDEAIKVLKRVIQLEPNKVQHYRNLANAYVNNNELEKA